MAEEKITEIMSDEELEQVAGGTLEECNKDLKFLRAIGALPSENVSNVDVDRAFAKLGIAYISYHFGDIPNRYYMDGKPVYRDTALKAALKKSGAKVDVNTGKKIDINDYLV